MNTVDFTLPNAQGEMISLSDFRGKKVIVYFYPKDSTPGCTTEACDFRDASEAFAAKNTVILGISADSQKRHQNFISKYELPFELLSDVDHTVCEQYGVWQLKKNYGKEYYGIVRSTFLINESGELIQEWRSVKVKDHVTEALSFLEQLN
ncbi:MULTISPECIES: thioredoxin-dependent thiol peroxidase [Exiguobacterium]|uniref:thioredoxin-dependent peroxiredoxin n=1 Tax=Exiguobacterium sibiricum (strain DSM 17290 / CCUG 55495 / CIP 109462 / JCM 13490 / 255-15) TaxID=262543 RepID=B1YM08_EXIS2|nr:MULTISPECIES: thioredoxin-dependent thiol peroxidase [Exiguobacterium]ACB61966.1 alkyl hydroperoxide reductase/ Thiol specific antioxidant/ Mal allergen [Exiguobacterium sibiricum 255-15]MCT4792928.1 thioredoxin-dependent thiol peroxidase [Exiguobacterium artemiae]MDX1259393.1 thioredoxin-dependent thiol peroxidase [Exiguobacterium sp. K1]